MCGIIDTFLTPHEGRSLAKKKRLRQIRLRLWEQNPIFFVCNQRIQDYADCSLEHVVPKSLGGKDDEFNFAVSHRNCNQFRKNTSCPLVWQNQDLVRKLKWMRTPSQILRAWRDKTFKPKEDI